MHEKFLLAKLLSVCHCTSQRSNRVMFLYSAEYTPMASCSRHKAKLSEFGYDLGSYRNPANR